MTLALAPSDRTAKLIRGTVWGTFAFGVLFSVDVAGRSEILLATAAAGLWVLLIETARHLRLPVDVLVLVGVISAQTAMAQTGGPSSPFLLFSLVPIALAAMASPARSAWSAAALNGAVLFATGSVISAPTTRIMQAVILYLLFAAAMLQARRIAPPDVTMAERARVEQLHDHLRSVAEMASSHDLDPPAIAARLAREIKRTVRVPNVTIRYATRSGHAVVYADEPASVDSDGNVYEFPLIAGGEQVGTVHVSPLDALSREDRERIDVLTRIAAKAFLNARTLEDIAERAIREERARLARELHDEIGPSIAALGLSLDALAADEPGDTRNELAVLRRRVEGLVDEIRTAVADLRSERDPTLTELAPALRSLVEEGGVGFTWILTEMEPVGFARRADLNAAVREAIRNALTHAKASTISVAGYVAGSAGRIVITDDGIGFEPASVPDSRFGLKGISERMHRLGGAVEIARIDGLTTVTLIWPMTKDGGS